MAELCGGSRSRNGQCVRDQAEVSRAKAYLESILAHLSTGVLVFDDGETRAKVPGFSGG